jgi:alpha/beta superfamily hydrolase
MRARSRAQAALFGPIALTAALLLAGCADNSAAKPPTSALETAEAASRDVRISSPYSSTPQSGDEDHTPIALDARIFGSGPVGVILVHKRPVDQTAWFPFATELAGTGRFTVLTFDMRGYGASTGDKAFDRADTDLMAAYNYARDTLRLSKVFLVGASVGGTATLLVAARVPVAGVVSVSSLAQFETMDALAAVPGIAAPKLFVISQDDVPARRSLDALLAAASEPKEQQVYEGDAHGTDIFEGPHAPELVQRIMDFLTAH